MSSGQWGSEGARDTSYPPWGRGPWTATSVTLTAQMEKLRHAQEKGAQEPGRRGLSTQVTQWLGRPQPPPTSSGHQTPRHRTSRSPHPRKHPGPRRAGTCMPDAAPHTRERGVKVVLGAVAQSYPTLCDPMDCSMPGLPVPYHLPESAQTHVHSVGDVIQPSHPLPPPSPPSYLSQHQGLSQ